MTIMQDYPLMVFMRLCFNVVDDIQEKNHKNFNKLLRKYKKVLSLHT